MSFSFMNATVRSPLMNSRAFVCLRRRASPRFTAPCATHKRDVGGSHRPERYVADKMTALGRFECEGSGAAPAHSSAHDSSCRRLGAASASAAWRRRCGRSSRFTARPAGQFATRFSAPSPRSNRRARPVPARSCADRDLAVCRTCGGRSPRPTPPLTRPGSQVARRGASSPPGSLADPPSRPRVRARAARARPRRREGCSQECQSPGSAKTTGMRSCIGRTSSFASQVMLVELGTTWPSGELQRVQRPAKQNGPPPVSEK
jgi:hypothetical protein